MATDAIQAIQDMGAAGLTSSSVEMADKGGIGVEMDLDLVPQREEGMTAYEIMLSESQERMLMVLKPGKEAQAKAIFDKYDLDAEVIGVTTDTGHMVLRQFGEVSAIFPCRRWRKTHRIMIGHGRRQNRASRWTFPNILSQTIMARFC